MPAAGEDMPLAVASYFNSLFMCCLCISVAPSGNSRSLPKGDVCSRRTVNHVTRPCYVDDAAVVPTLSFHHAPRRGSKTNGAGQAPTRIVEDRSSQRSRPWRELSPPAAPLRRHELAVFRPHGLDAVCCQRGCSNRLVRRFEGSEMSWTAAGRRSVPYRIAQAGAGGPAGQGCERLRVSAASTGTYVYLAIAPAEPR